MSEDLQGDRWWLASDGKWYPPDLHPSVRAAASEQDRNAALLSATFGVARVREEVVSEVLAGLKTEVQAGGDTQDTHAGPAVATSDRDLPWRPGAEPIPRFHTREAADWAQQAREQTSPAVISRSDEGSATASTASTDPGGRVAGSTPPPVPRWTPTASERPPERTTSLSTSAPPETPPSPSPSPPAPRFSRTARFAQPTVPHRTVSPAAFDKPAFPPPPPAISATSTLVSSTPEPPPPPTDPASLLEGRVLPPSARRRPSKVRSTSDLRDAVAGAVARAAAQGPLVPHGADEQESDIENSQPQQHPVEPPTSADAGSSAPEARSILVAPVESGTNAESETDHTVSTTDSETVDPYEEIAGLAGQYASTDTAPHLHNGRSSPWPAPTDLTDQRSPKTEADETTLPEVPEVEDAPGEVTIADDTTFDPKVLETTARDAAALEAAALEAAALEEAALEEAALEEQSGDEEVPGEALPGSLVLEAAVLGETVGEATVLEELAEEATLVHETEPEAVPLDTMPEQTARAEVETHEVTEAKDLLVVETASEPQSGQDAPVHEDTPDHKDTPTAEDATEAVLPDREVQDEAVDETGVAEITQPTDTVPDSETLDIATPDNTPEEDTSAEQAAVEDSAWPFGERRSAARQARKPLPAALQEAVAAGAAQDLAESASQSASGQQSTPADGPKGAKADGPGAATGSGKNPDTNTPGLLRRYGSAIAIVVLFLVAGGVAAGIAAFRGPVNTPLASTAPQDRAAANATVLPAASFPSAWHVSRASSVGTSYGLGSALVTRSMVLTWLTSHPSCSAQLNEVREAMTPAFGDVTAVAYAQASTTNPLGGLWQIADVVAFHTSPAEVKTGLATMQTLLRQPKSQQCVAQFWTAALISPLPSGSTVTMTVSPRALPPLAGNPTGWAMQMNGTEVVGQTSLPLRFKITSFAAGRAQVFFVVSSKAAALPGKLAARLLATLALRAERLAAPGA